MTVALCLMFAGILESCIQCGLIQSNLEYDELFEATNLPVQITDQSLRTQHISAAMPEPLPQNELQRMTSDTVQLGRRYAFEAVFPSPGVCVLEGGHFRTESAPNGVGADARRASRYRRCSGSGECTAREAFEADRGKPSVRHDGNPDLRADRHAAGTSGRIKKHRRSGSGQTSAWTDHHHRNLCQAQKQPDLCQAAAAVRPPCRSCRLCLNESVENLNLYGVDCKALVKGDGQLSFEQAAKAYDLFETVVEATLDSLHSLLISIESGEPMEVNLCISAAEPLCNLPEQIPGLQWEQDEDGLQYITRKLKKTESR